jgi:uncharacterized pyridoxal phosphate-containing UPF0001 family protein
MRNNYVEIPKPREIYISSNYLNGCFDRISHFQDKLGRRMHLEINWDFIGELQGLKLWLLRGFRFM